MSSKLWRGMVEKRGNDIIRRWLVRELIIYEHECLYYDPSSGQLRGSIPFAAAISVKEAGQVIELRTSGDKKKISERNGRVFEFRINDTTEREIFLTTLKSALQSYRQQVGGIPPKPSLDKTQDDVVGYDYDDVSGSVRTDGQKIGLNIEQSALDKARSKLRRKESNHEIGENEFLDIAHENAEDDPSYADQMNFFRYAKLYVSHMELLDMEWEDVCKSLSSPGKPSLSAPKTPSTLRNRPKNLILGIKPLAAPASPVNGKPSSPRKVGFGSSVFRRDPSESMRSRDDIAAAASVKSKGEIYQVTSQGRPILNLDELYNCAGSVRPAFNTLLSDVKDACLSDSDPAVDVTVESRLLSPHEAMESLQQCGVHSYISATASVTAAAAAPSHASFLPPNMLPESCLSNILSGRIVCKTAEQVAAAVDAIRQRVVVDFLDNRFLHPLGQPPVTNIASLSVQAVYYNGSYHRDVRLIIEVPYKTSGSSYAFKCEVTVELAALRAIQTSVSPAPSPGVPDGNEFETMLRPYFTRYRSWCRHADVCVDEEDDDNGEMADVMSVLYSKDICRRVDLLRQIAALSYDEYTEEVDTFIDAIESDEYQASPDDCEGGYFMRLMQETRASGDMLLLRSLCSMFYDMELYMGCAIIQKDIVTAQRKKMQRNPDETGDEALCFELEMLAHMLLKDGDDAGLAEAVGLLEECIQLREAIVSQYGEGKDVSVCALTGSMLLLANVHDERGALDEAEDVLKKAASICTSYPGNEKSLSLVLQGTGMLLEQTNRLVDSEEKLKLALEMQRRQLGSKHPVVAGTLLDLALVHTSLGMVIDAEKAAKEGLAIRAEYCGLHHPCVSDALLAMVPVLNILGKYSESKAYVEKCLHIRKKLSGSQCCGVAECYVEYGMICKLMKEYGRAREYIEHGLRIYYNKLGQQCSEVAHAVTCLASVLELQGEHATAKEMYQMLLRIRRGMSDEDSPEVASALLLLANICLEMGNHEEAEQRAQECISIQLRIFPTALAEGGREQVPVHGSAVECMSVLARVCKAQTRCVPNVYSLHVRSAQCQVSGCNFLV